MTVAPLVEITDRPLDEGRYRGAVAGNGYGAVVVFSGVTRDAAAGRQVVRLLYEAYEEMALSVMRWIVKRARLEWNFGKVAIGHRIGSVDVGQPGLILAVSAAHRKEAFAALEYIAAEIKSIVPIWKKEIFTDGEAWVGGGA